VQRQLQPGCVVVAAGRNLGMLNVVKRDHGFAAAVSYYQFAPFAFEI
jgi:hypothetical protein